MSAATLERAELVGKGRSADVYAWGQGHILKLFRGRAAHGRAHREYALTREIHASGLPVPAAYDVVQVEGRWGIVFERIEGVSLLGSIHARPWTLFAAIEQLAELHARIHRHPAPAGLPPLRERVAAAIEASDSPEADKQAARERLSALPDGTALCHGDFHPGNVLVTPRGLMVIDWDMASRGDPIGDVACTSRLLRIASLPPGSPAYLQLLFECLRPVIHGSYLKRTLELHSVTRRQVEEWQAPIAVAGRLWFLRPGQRGARIDPSRHESQAPAG